MGDVGEDDLEVIRTILVEVQLAQFFTRIRDDLQVGFFSFTCLFIIIIFLFYDAFMYITFFV